MSQSATIAAALIAGFVLFLAARSRLATYAAVLWGSTAAPVPQPSGAQAGAQAGSSAGNTAGNMLSTAAKFLPEALAVAGA